MTAQDDSTALGKLKTKTAAPVNQKSDDARGQARVPTSKSTPTATTVNAWETGRLQQTAFFKPKGQVLSAPVRTSTVSTKMLAQSTVQHQGDTCTCECKCTCNCACRRCASRKLKEKVSRKTNASRGAFKQGQILSVPLHVSNMDPSLSWSDRDLKLSNAGPVYSKYRPVVVFRKFHTQMECLPLYTNKGKGMDYKCDKEEKEWISVVDGPETDSPCEDTYRPLTVLFRGTEKVKAKSCIHITHSVMVECAENVEHKGVMGRASFERLHKLRAALDKSAPG